MPPKKRNRIETEGEVEGTSTGRKRGGGWSAGRHGTSRPDTSPRGRLSQGMREVTGKVFSGTSPEEPNARTEPPGISGPTGGLIDLRESASSGTQHAQQEEWRLKRRQEKSKKAKIEPPDISGPTGGLIDLGESTSAQPERGLKRPQEVAKEDISPAKKRIKLEPPAKSITPDSATRRLPGERAESSKSKKPNFEPTQEDYGLLADITEHEINTAIRILTDDTKKEDKKATTNANMLKKAEGYIRGKIRARNGLKSKPKENMIAILKEGDPTRIASGLILKEILRAKKEKEWTVREGPKILEEACTAISKVLTDMPEVFTDMSDITVNYIDKIKDNIEILNTQYRLIKSIISSIKVVFAPDSAAGRLPGTGTKGKEVARDRNSSSSEGNRSSSPDIPLAASLAEKRKVGFTSDSAAESSESKKPNFEPTQEDYGLLAVIEEDEISSAIQKLTDHTEKDKKATNSEYRLGKAGRYIKNEEGRRKDLESYPEKTMIDILKNEEEDLTITASGLILKEILRAKKEIEWHKKNFISTVGEGYKTFGEVRTAISKVYTDILAITGNNTDTIEDNLKTLDTQDGQIEGIISSIYEAYEVLRWAKGSQFPGNWMLGQDLPDAKAEPSKGPLDEPPPNWDDLPPLE